MNVIIEKRPDMSLLSEVVSTLQFQYNPEEMSDEILKKYLDVFGVTYKELGEVLMQRVLKMIQTGDVSESIVLNIDDVFVSIRLENEEE